MDLHRTSAGDNETGRYKQNFDSSEFNLNGLNCKYIHDYRLLQHSVCRDYSKICECLIMNRNLYFSVVVSIVPMVTP